MFLIPLLVFMIQLLVFTTVLRMAFYYRTLFDHSAGVPDIIYTSNKISVLAVHHSYGDTYDMWHYLRI